MRYLTLLLLLASCAPKPSDCTQYIKNVYGQSIVWRSKSVTLNIDASVPKHLVPSIYRAAHTWNRAIGRDQIVLTEQISYKNNILYLSSWEADRSSEQARASIKWAGDSIVSGDIKVNSKNFVFYDNLPKTNQFSFEAIMVHEMGHFLGLTHAESNSVMVKYLGAREDRVNLFEEDIKQIQCEYK